jgi:hypothetical protein
MKNGDQISRDQIINEIKRVAREKGSDSITRSEFYTNTGISSWQIYQRFEGWAEACQLAGLMPNQKCVRISDDILFEEMNRVFLSQGAIITRTKFDKQSKYSVDTYKKHFGNWRETLLAFRKWLEQRGEESPFIDPLPLITKAEPKTNKAPIDTISSEIQDWQSVGGTKYGPFLNFRGLQHAPLNEQGVVFLFGMICRDLGFIVEAVRTGYPDCEAKRRIDKKRDSWERVRIEFEYRSSSFKDHGHNPRICDVIICWEHDWLECPLEVLELRSIISSLKE